MDEYTVTLSLDKQAHVFKVTEHPHYNSGSCRYKVYQEDKLVAGFMPDDQHFLQICHNTGMVKEELLHMLADYMERYHPRKLKPEHF